MVKPTIFILYLPTRPEAPKLNKINAVAVAVLLFNS